jgi:5'-nucleotidase
VPTSHAGIEPDPALAALVESHRQAVAPLASRVVGRAASDLDNAAVDRVAVHAQRAFAKADLAFLNPGNTRSDIDAGSITYAEASEVQAYEHPVWRLRMDGSDLLEVMAEQPGLLVSGSRDLDPGAVYTVAANGIVAEREPFLRAAERERVGTDLEALIAWLARDGGDNAAYASARP